MSGKREFLARWLAGDGIEIGALHRPLPVPDGARVRYVDHLPEEQLREHYPELAEHPFAPVSIIGSAEDLGVIPDGSLDFVIANHLLEHLEYPVRGLLEFQRVLRRDGILYLALPDQRQTFDRERPLTSTDHLLAEQRTSGAPANRRAHFLEWAKKVDGKSGAEAEAHAEALLKKGYAIHFHVFRPDTFLDFFVAARQEFDLDFDVLALEGAHHPADDEFILLLARGRHGRVRPPRVDAPASNGLWGWLRSSQIARPLRAARRRLVRGSSAGG